MLAWSLSIIAILGCGYWFRSAWLLLRVARNVPVLADLRPSEPARWPRLSVIIPACNEADTLETAMRERLREDYPHIEFIIINDRSTDATGEIAERLAASDARVRVVHVRDLPDGWLGKVHAMQRGLDAAKGDILLFSDADAIVAAGVMRTAAAFCEQRHVEFLTVLPQVLPGTFMLDAALSTFIRLLCVTGRAWAMRAPRSSASIGFGPFNLVRRSVLDRAGGLERLRLAAVDDLALARLLKRAGASCAVVNGRDRVGFPFYHTLPAMFRGMEKNIFPMYGFSLLRVVVVSIMHCLLELGPCFGLLPSPVSWLLTVSLIALFAAAVQCAAVNRWLGRPMLPAAAFPLGALLLTLGSIRAGILGVLRGGILWRGTLYPTAVLRTADQFIAE